MKSRVRGATSGRASRPGEYRPSRWLLAAIVASFLLFGGFLASELLAAEPRLWLVLGFGVCTLIGIAAIVETLVSEVRIQDDAVLIRGLRGTRAFAYEEIESVKLEGGTTALEMKSGKWEKLPEWLAYGASMSARHRIAAKLEAGARKRREA